MDALLLLVQISGYALCVLLPIIAWASWDARVPFAQTFDVPEDDLIVLPFSLERPKGPRHVTSTVTMIGYNDLNWPAGAPCPVAEAETVIASRTVVVG